MNSKKAGETYYKKYPFHSIWEVLEIACNDKAINARSRKQVDIFLSSYENSKYPKNSNFNLYIDHVQENQPVIFNLNEKNI